MKKLAQNPRFWPIPIMLVALSVVHYAPQLGIASGDLLSLQLGLSRHALDRMLFLAPLLYAGYSMRLRVGLGVCLVALAVMLPRALFVAPYQWDALVEIGGILLVGVLASFWFDTQIRAREQQRVASRELETVQENLQTQIRLARSNAKRLATLNSISGMLSRSLESEHLLRSAIDLVTEVMEVEIALIFTIDKEPPELRLSAHEGVSDAFVDAAQNMAPGSFNHRVAANGDVLLVQDATDDPGLSREVLKREKIESELIVPLRAKGVITGTLCVANRRPRRFLPEEVELLTAIGAQIGIALENTRLYRQEQMMAVQYRSIFENTTEAIWLHDLKGDILNVNRAAASLTGYDLEELARMNVSQFLPADELAVSREKQGKLLRGEMRAGEPYDQRIIRKDRSDVLVRVGSSPIYEGGQLVGFQHIATDVTKERLMQENLRNYIEAVTKAQEEERKRIARELHDETAQQLIALSRQLDDFSIDNRRLSPEDVEVLTSWRRQLKEALQGVRLFSRDLRPPMIDDLGLAPALEWLTGHLREETSIDVGLKVFGTQRRLTPETELLLFRIAQEALNNARRHAQASSVEVSVEFGADAVSVAVQDNGKGFKLPDSVGDLSRTGRLGLMGIEERSRLLGASLTIDSEPGRGTTIRVKAPV